MVWVWHAMQNLLLYLFRHMESKLGQVLVVLVGHKVQFGFGSVVDQNIYF